AVGALRLVSWPRPVLRADDCAEAGGPNHARLVRARAKAGNLLGILAKQQEPVFNRGQGYLRPPILVLSASEIGLGLLQIFSGYGLLLMQPACAVGHSLSSVQSDLGLSQVRTR